MPRVYVVGILVIVALTVFAIVDAAMTDKYRIRGLPKLLWILVILILPVIGPILWLTIGKDRGKAKAQPRSVAPDDDPDFLRRLGTEKEQEERIRRLERELADLDDDTPTKE